MGRNKKNSFEKLTYFLLGLIFAGALFLRLYNLSNFPVSFQIDEASLGYNAYSFLLTGKDDNNERFPLYIDIFGDNRPSGYHYLAILPVKVLGLSEFATRLPGVFFGSITIFALFYLAWVLFQDKKTALLASFLLAIAPWHVVLSRASAETIVALFFIILGFGFFLYGLQKERGKYLVIGGFTLIISFFFYHTPRVFVPFMLFISLISLSSLWQKSKSIHFKKVLVSIFLTISILSFALIFFVSGGTGRFNQVNIFGFPETKLVLAEQIREDGVSGVGGIATRIFHNKIVNYSLTFIENYFTYFSGEFLFIKGGLPIWYQVPRMGLFYFVELPFIVYGIYMLFKQKETAAKIPLLWILFAPVVAATTVDDVPNIQRAIVLFPMFNLIAAYGFGQFLSEKTYKQKRMTILISSLFLLFNFSYFLHQYFIHTKVHRPWYRSNGFKEMMGEVKKSYDNYDRIVMSKGGGGVYPLVLFYMQYDPAFYQAEGSPKDKEYGGFGKFMFVPQDCPSLVRDDRFPTVKKAIYVNRGACPDSKSIVYKDIYREDGTKAFRIAYEELP